MRSLPGPQCHSKMILNAAEHPNKKGLAREERQPLSEWRGRGYQLRLRLDLAMLRSPDTTIALE